MRTERNRKCYTFGMILVALVLLVCFATQLVAYADGFSVGSIAYVCVDTKLNIREKPQGKIIGKLPNGETVTILSEIDRNGYYRIRVNRTNQECYAYGEYLRLYAENNASSNSQTQISQPNSSGNDYVIKSQYENTDLENAILVVTSDKKLNMRENPSKKSNRVKYLTNGDKVQVISTTVKNNYVLVKDLTDGKVGYVDINYLAFDSTEYTDSAPGTLTQQNCNCNCCCQSW